MCGPIFASLSFNGVVWTPSLETGMGICVTMDQCVQRRASSVLCDVIIRNRGTSDLLYVMLQYLLLDPESQVWNYTVGSLELYSWCATACAARFVLCKFFFFFWFFLFVFLFFCFFCCCCCLIILLLMVIMSAIWRHPGAVAPPNTSGIDVQKLHGYSVEPSSPLCI